LLIIYLIFRYKDKKESNLNKPINIVKPIIIYVVVMAICLFLNSYFKTTAAKYLNAAQLYPINYGGSLILSMLMSTIIFKEKLNLKCIIGVLLSFVALILINLF
jgi:multidrug transporter EmrE-like cation transporter